MLERLGSEVRRALILGQSQARRMGHGATSNLHVLMGLLVEESGLAVRLLHGVGVSVEAVRQDVARSLEGVKVEDPNQVGFSPSARTLIQLSANQALRMGSQVVQVEHILWALSRMSDDPACVILNEAGGDAQTLRNIQDDLGLNRSLRNSAGERGLIHDETMRLEATARLKSGGSETGKE